MSFSFYPIMTAIDDGSCFFYNSPCLSLSREKSPSVRVKSVSIQASLEAAKLILTGHTECLKSSYFLRIHS